MFGIIELEVGMVVDSKGMGALVAITWLSGMWA
jgi:hypothetical protein